MRCITLTQPWATLVAIGAKKIETRSWATKYRGPLAIHAAKGLGLVGGMLGLDMLCHDEPFMSALGEFGPAGVEQLPLGAIVAVCRMVDCVPTRTTFPGWKRWQYPGTDQSIRWEMTDQERAFGNYDEGRFAWLLADIQALPEPIPAKGALGLWEPDASILEAINQQV